MSLSSFCVVSNALRLNFFKLHCSKKDKKIKNAVTGDCLIHTMDGQVQTMTIHIKGMMCPHCEATVKKALEALPQIQRATADHVKGTAVLVLNEPVSPSVLKKALKAEGYQLLSN